MYQRVTRSTEQADQLQIVHALVVQQRRLMPRVGTRKLHYLLKDELDAKGIKLGRDGLFRLLRCSHMLITPKKNYTKTTHSKHWLTKHPNLMKQVRPTHPEQYFVSDITYVKSAERTHYLSLVTDAYSRKIMGYHLSDDLSAESVAQALKKAVRHRHTTQELVHHSDRGLQYCSSVYQRQLRLNNILPSMTDGYDCYQNALAERVNGILKGEFLIYRCRTGKELNTLISESIDTYNNKRPHLSLGMKTPTFIHEKTRELTHSGS
jgi:transposase InsO family protein